MAHISDQQLTQALATLGDISVATRQILANDSGARALATVILLDAQRLQQLLEDVQGAKRFAMFTRDEVGE